MPNLAYGFPMVPQRFTFCYETPWFPYFSNIFSLRFPNLAYGFPMVSILLPWTLPIRKPITWGVGSTQPLLPQLQMRNSTTMASIPIVAAMCFLPGNWTNADSVDMPISGSGHVFFVGCLRPR